MNILILDDDPMRIASFVSSFFADGPYHSVDVVNSAALCIEKLKQNIYDVVFLDHDLDGRTFAPLHEGNTGSRVSRWIKNNPQLDTVFILHSLNIDAASHMVDNMQGRVKQVLKRPFAWEQPMLYIKNSS